MARPDLKGVITAALTPIDDELGIDVPRLAAHIKSVLADGCTMVSTFGTTGEGTSFSGREKRAAHAALLAAGIAPTQLLPAVMACAVDEAAGQLADIADIGCRHVLILPPFYYRQAPLSGLVQYLEALYRRANSPDIGVVLYNIPAMSGITITHDLIVRLKERGVVPVVGVKDSTGNLESGLSYVKAFPELSIFTGDDRVLSPLLKAGGAGMIGGLPNLYAADLVALSKAPEGPEKQRLVELAGARIADIDARGGLTALKADLAKKLSDPNWTRVLPPLGLAAVG
ncbi:MAG TPA: dihydrodipicolinate synthase family protein [Devosiaceae bacterium]